MMDYIFGDITGTASHNLGFSCIAKNQFVQSLSLERCIEAECDMGTFRVGPLFYNGASNYCALLLETRCIQLAEDQEKG